MTCCSNIGLIIGAYGMTCFRNTECLLHLENRPWS